MKLIVLLVAVAVFMAWRSLRRRGRGDDGNAPAEAPRWLPYRWVYPRVRRFRWVSLVPRWARWAALWAVVGLVVGFRTRPLETAALCVVVAAAAYGVTRLLRERRRHFRDLLFPLWLAVAPLVGIPRGENVRAWLTVPYQLDGEKTRVVLRVPIDYRGSDMQRGEVEDLMARRLPGEWEARWDWTPGRFRVELKHPPAPPKYIALQDVASLMANASDAKPLIGLGARGDAVYGDLDQEAPHWALSMGTGAGKSTFLRVVICQLARHTATGAVEAIHVLDPKRISQNAFRGVPGVHLHKTADAWRATIREFRAEMERRYDVLDEDENADFPRRVLIIEEMNSFTRLLKEWWDSVRDSKDPRTPPTMNDLSFILNQGRQAKMHVIVVLQQANARAMGGSEARDQFGMKLMARFSPAVWQMLVGTYPRPRSSRHPGRAIVLVGDDMRTLQMIDVVPQQAREFALNGRQPTHAAPASPRLSMDKQDTPQAGTTPGFVPGQSTDITGRNGHPGEVAHGDETGRPALHVVPDPDPDPNSQPIVGLKAAARFLGMNSDAFKKARQRDEIHGEFREGTSPAWLPDTLTEWHRNRPRAGARQLPEEARS